MLRIILIMCVLLTFTVVGQPSLSTIEIVTTDAWGSKLESGKLQLLDPKGTRIREMEPNGSISGVRFGTYYLEGIDIPVARRRIIVNTANLFVRLGSSATWGLRQHDGGDNTIKVRLRPHPTDPEKWWLLITGVFFDERREQRHIDHGAFVVGGLQMGLYVAQVFREGELRGQAEVSLEPDQANWTKEISISVRIDDPGTLRLQRK